jgi:hypothetical protein
MKPTTVQQFVDRLRSAKGKGIRYGMGHGGEHPDDDLPTRDGECDCSAFQCWGMGVGKSPNKNPTGTWLGTGGMYTDAMTKQVVLERIPEPEFGCLAIYTAVPGKAGHVACVTDVAARTIIDCSSSQGGINEHSGAYFWKNKKTIWARVKGLQHAA